MNDALPPVPPTLVAPMPPATASTLHGVSDVQQAPTFAPTPLPTPPPPPKVAPPESMDTVRTLIGDAILHSLRVIGPQAYFEQLARTEPALFQKYVAALLPQQPRGGDRNITIQNLVSPLPRSPLDMLPPDFDAHR